MEIESAEGQSTVEALEEAISNQINQKKSEGKIALANEENSELLVEILNNEEEVIDFFGSRKDHFNVGAAVAATAMVTAATAAITAAAGLHAKGKDPDSQKELHLMDAQTSGLNISDLLDLRENCL